MDNEVRYCPFCDWPLDEWYEYICTEKYDGRIECDCGFSMSIIHSLDSEYRNKRDWWLDYYNENASLMFWESRDLPWTTI